MHPRGHVRQRSPQRQRAGANVVALDPVGDVDHARLRADARDHAVAKVMKDPRLAKLMNPKAMPFDGKRMIWGGFKVLLAL